MPFKVKYRIYEPGTTASVYETADRALAYVEWNERRRHKALTRMVPEVTPVNPSKQESYAWLVYRVLKAIRKYYDERGHVTKEQSQDNLKVSLALEKELDDWNTRTRFYLQRHPNSTPDDPRAFAFFEVVEMWREEWHKYFRYKKQAGKDPLVEREMYKKCTQMETEINPTLTSLL